MAHNGTIYSAVIIGALAVLTARGLAPVREIAATPKSRDVQTQYVEPSPAQPPAQATIGGFGTVVLPRAPDNHFYADAQVNGAAIRFLVDTGASSVVLTPEDARRAGIGGYDYSAVGIGAGGEIKLMRATVNRLAIGSLSAHDVPVMVAQGGLTQSLLGQSFLARLDNVSIAGDEMVLR